MCACVHLCECVCLHSCILACKWNHFGERRIFSLCGCVWRCVHMRAHTSRREAINLLCIFVCVIVLVKEGVCVCVCVCACACVRTCIHKCLVYVLCVQPPRPLQLWQWCVPPQVLFQSADCHPKMLFSWVLFKTIVSGAPDSFYKGPLQHWGLTCCLWSSDQQRGVRVCVRACVLYPPFATCSFVYLIILSERKQ